MKTMVLIANKKVGRGLSKWIDCIRDSTGTLGEPIISTTYKIRRSEAKPLKCHNSQVNDKSTKN